MSVEMNFVEFESPRHVGYFFYVEVSNVAAVLNYDTLKDMSIIVLKDGTELPARGTPNEVLNQIKKQMERR